MFFRRNRPKQYYPPWLKWVIIGLIALALFSNAHNGPPSAPSPVHQALEKAQENLNPNHVFSDYKTTIFPNYHATLRVKDVTPGEGPPAVCGQHVTIAYETFVSDKPVADKADKGDPLEFTIGEGKEIPALEQGVVGMQLGGKRSIFAPASMTHVPGEATSPTDASQRFEVELLSTAPAIPDGPFRIAVTHPGNGTALLCGEKVNTKVTLWSVDGKQLFSGPAAFTLGKSEVFLGLEQGVIGMENGETRTLIVSPAFQKTMNGNPANVDFPLPKTQTVLVDVEALP